MTFGLDTNILIYALDPTEGDKHHIASQIIIQGLTRDMAIAAQVLGEYLNVARRKMPHRLTTAFDIVNALSLMLPVISTTARHIEHGGRLSLKHDLQFWDALIIGVYGSADITLVVTEDLQDGQTIDGVEIFNPFQASNAARLADLIGA